MKGTLFQKPLELTLNIDGETWKQGEEIIGTLTVKNHGNDNVDLSMTGVTLAIGDGKKIKAKHEKAFVIQDQALFGEDIQLASNEQKVLDCSFKLSKDSAITQKADGPYIVFGDSSNLLEGELLQLQVMPIASITNFLEVFGNFFRFKTKTLKNKKGYIEAKMEAPGSKEYGAIEQLMLLMKMDGENLELKYTFKVQKLAYQTAGVEAKSEKVELNQTLTPRQYKIYGDAPNQDGMMKAIEEILREVKRSTTF